MSIQFDVPFDEYLRWPELSQSTLKAGMKSMAHLKATLDGERQREMTDAMTLGSALHAAFLEPEQVTDKVVVWDGGARRGQAWTEFKTANEAKYILTENQHAKLVGMMRSLRRHPKVREWLGKIEHTEVATKGEIFGVPMKARCDALTSDPLIDLKMTNDLSARAVTNTVLTFGYHIQGYIYSQLFKRDRWLLLCVEDEPPFDVVPYELSPAFLRIGRHVVGDVINQYKHALKTGIWPGISDDVILLEPPEYAFPFGMGEVELGEDAA